MNTKILNAREAVRLLVEAHPEILQDAWCPTLFGGDRMSCCDEAAIVEINGKVVALATLAPEGEMNEGVPTIVGLYTIRAERRRGYGKAVLEATIRRGIARGFQKIRVDVLTTKAMQTIHALPQELQDVLIVNDQTMFGFLD
ncbi:MAG: hypothetical protein UX81_C0002G0043 [Parcubacteria group bacterium GW2011_GWA2_47_12]|nr:MAG: hypothetical protein UX81_C0002G0043 [Parcubacteria group bacterium GW2011_GWA2_47_12]